MTEEQEREWFDRHDREHEEPRDFADECHVCEVRYQERVENGEYDDEDSTVVATLIPGTLGIGVGKMFEPIPERGDDGFHSIIWFPYEAREDAEEMVASSEGRYVMREGVAL